MINSRGSVFLDIIIAVILLLLVVMPYTNTIVSTERYNVYLKDTLLVDNLCKYKMDELISILQDPDGFYSIPDEDTGDFEDLGYSEVYWEYKLHYWSTSGASEPDMVRIDVQTWCDIKDLNLFNNRELRCTYISFVSKRREEN